MDNSFDSEPQNKKKKIQYQWILNHCFTDVELASFI